jgi:hypothetical protein
MFNKNIEITVITRFKNEDHFKIAKLAETYKESEEPVMINGIDNEVVEVKFVTRKGCLKKFKEHLNLLTFVGIKAEMK